MNKIISFLFSMIVLSSCAAKRQKGSEVSASIDLAEGVHYNAPVNGQQTISFKMKDGSFLEIAPPIKVENTNSNYAETNCRDLSFAGKEDWRMMNTAEYAELIKIKSI